jgi:hypothetical protein
MGENRATLDLRMSLISVAQKNHVMRHREQDGPRNRPLFHSWGMREEIGTSAENRKRLTTKIFASAVLDLIDAHAAYTADLD